MNVDDGNACTVDSCDPTTGGISHTPIPGCGIDAGFLVIDEDSIDNGIGPNDFTEEDLNEDHPSIGLREQLQWFKENPNKKIDLYTGQMGDEAWFALKTIPENWSNTENPDGLRNFVSAAPPIGTSEDRLDKIDNVTPLRAEGLNNLVGETVCAVVYDSDISINYDDPINGSLKGDNLGIVAFYVDDIRQRTGGSSSDLPIMTIIVKDADDVCPGPLFLFTDTEAPVLISSSEEWDVIPNASG